MRGEQAGTGLDALSRRVRELPGRPVLVGIAGAPGSGKTTLAQALTMRVAGAVHVPMDGFHLADAALDQLGRRDRKGAPDTFDVDGYTALLRRIRAGEAVWAPAFDRRVEQPIAQSILVPATARVVISEGNYLLLDGWAAARRLFDEVWFCRIDDAVRRERLVARHVRFGKAPEQARDWVARVDEPNAALVEATSGRADLVV